jgi:hypothetical protein
MSCSSLFSLLSVSFTNHAVCTFLPPSSSPPSFRSVLPCFYPILLLLYFCFLLSDASMNQVCPHPFLSLTLSSMTPNFLHFSGASNPLLGPALCCISLARLQSHLHHFLVCQSYSIDVLKEVVVDSVQRLIFQHFFWVAV